jgi:hypothetical protein
MPALGLKPSVFLRLRLRFSQGRAKPVAPGSDRVRRRFGKVRSDSVRKLKSRIVTAVNRLNRMRRIDRPARSPFARSVYGSAGGSVAVSNRRATRKIPSRS